MENYAEDAKKFGMLSKPIDCVQFLKENPHIVSEDTAGFLCIWCIDLAVEGKLELMDRVARQAVNLQFLLEVAHSQKAHPREIIEKMEGDYKISFEEELASFKLRVMERARIRIEDAKAAVEEEERQKRLGPGGLDPLEVMETLPPELKECFEKRDTELLKTVLLSLSPEDAEYHFKRCIDSGLWVPNTQPEDEQEEFEQVVPDSCIPPQTENLQ